MKYKKVSTGVRYMLRGLTKIIVLCFTLGTVSCGRSNISYTQESNHIVGGDTLDTLDSLPNHVVLLKTRYLNKTGGNPDTSYCTGVLITNRYVLTAAHCVKFNKITSAEIVFPLAKKVERYQENQVTVHAEYTGENLNREYDKLRDIALIRLKDEPPSPYKSISILSEKLSYSQLQKTVTFTSLGFGDQQGSFLKKTKRTFELKQVLLDTDNYEPRNTYFEVDQENKGICFGDSGGPAIIRVDNQNYLLGIAIDVLFNPTRAFEVNYDLCLEKAVFLNLLYFKKWIDLHLQDS